MSNMGRPSEFTEEKLNSFLECISLGSSKLLAANAIGYSLGGLQKLEKKGKVDLSEGNVTLFSRLVVGIKEARGNRVKKWLSIIENAANNGLWTASAWKLERIHWKEFGNNQAARELEERLHELESKMKKEFSNGESKEVDPKSD